MSNLKIGQKVRLIGYPGKTDKYNPKDTDGIIISVTADFNPIIVEWQGNPKIRNSYIPKYLEIV